jgi:hypothetical protein
MRGDALTVSVRPGEGSATQSPSAVARHASTARSCSPRSQTVAPSAATSTSAAPLSAASSQIGVTASPRSTNAPPSVSTAAESALAAESARSGIGRLFASSERHGGASVTRGAALTSGGGGARVAGTCGRAHPTSSSSAPRVAVMAPPPGSSA